MISEAAMPHVNKAKAAIIEGPLKSLVKAEMLFMHAKPHTMLLEVEAIAQLWRCICLHGPSYKSMNQEHPTFGLLLAFYCKFYNVSSMVSPIHTTNTAVMVMLMHLLHLHSQLVHQVTILALVSSLFEGFVQACYQFQTCTQVNYQCVDVIYQFTFQIRQMMCRTIARHNHV